MSRRKIAIIIVGAVLVICGFAGVAFAVTSIQNSKKPISSESVITTTTATSDATITSDTDSTDVSTSAEATGDSETETDNTSESDETSDTDASEETDTTTTSKSGSSSKTPELTIGKKKYKLRKNMEILLIMGIDDRGTIKNDGETIHASQADCIYVYAFDHNKKTFQALQINRDSMASVREIFGHGFEDEFSNMQICLAHSYGKNEKARCLNTVEAVKKMISNTPIDHYVSLKMEGIATFNDQVGGVTIKMPAGLERIDPAFKEGETFTFRGKQAEKFLRARYYMEDDHNSERMKRQEIYMKAWKKQALSKLNNDSGFPAKMILALSEYMYSDMSANKLSSLASSLKDYKDLGTLTPSGKTLEPGNGRKYREFHVNKDDLKKKVVELFYEPA